MIRSAADQTMLRKVMRRYRRNGYTVVEPGRVGVKPEFLGSLVPDLIAESADDRVVIEVKQASELKGSNTLVELSERVSAQPGWRFELVGVQPDQPEQTLMPGVIERMISQYRGAIERGDFEFALFGSLMIVESLLADLAGWHGLKSDHPPLRQAWELVTRGLIPDEIWKSVTRLYAQRQGLRFQRAAEAPSRQDTEATIELIYRIWRERQPSAG